MVARLNAPAGSALAARIGIATGPVVVGELIGKGLAQEELVVGETPNLAARLQARAQPGTVAIAEGTRRLLGSSALVTARLGLSWRDEPVVVDTVGGQGFRQKSGR